MAEVDSLQRAKAALDQGDTPAARRELIEAWKTSRAPVLAELISLLDARQPDDVPALLKAVVTHTVRATFERFTSLMTRDDPRVSGFALDSLERLPFTTPGVQPLVEAFVKVVVQRKDVRLLPRAKVIREGIRTRITRAPVRDSLLAELDAAVLTLRNLELTSAPEAIALHQALSARLLSLAAPAQSEEALLDAVYAQPKDDGPRLVYADWLLERNDPRGEFITLQFKRRAAGLSDAETKRERALLKKHGASWLGALAPVLSFGWSYSGTTFERGFISTADIILSVGKKLEPLWRAKEWRTVERLEGNWPLELLERAPLRGLRTVSRSLSTGTLTSLRKGGLQLEADSIELDSATRDWELVRAVFPKLSALAVWCNGVPSLEVIQEYAKLGVPRLELRRTWNAPRGAEQDAEFARLLEVLKVTPLPFAQLALMTSWTGSGLPPLLELRASERGMVLAR